MAWLIVIAAVLVHGSCLPALHDTLPPADAQR
jgi:hypothetical protein